MRIIYYKYAYQEHTHTHTHIHDVMLYSSGDGGDFDDNNNTKSHRQIDNSNVMTINRYHTFLLLQRFLRTRWQDLCPIHHLFAHFCVIYFFTSRVFHHILELCISYSSHLSLRCIIRTHEQFYGLLQLNRKRTGLRDPYVPTRVQLI